MDASLMKDLRAVTRKALKQVGDLSGNGIKFVSDDDLPVPDDDADGLARRALPRRGVPPEQRTARLVHCVPGGLSRPAVLVSGRRTALARTL